MMALPTWLASRLPQNGQKVVRFPLRSKKSEILGTMWEPVVTVSVWSEATRSWKQVQMLVDTGADYTLLPAYIASWLELDYRTEGKTVETHGVGGTQTVYIVPDVKVKVGSFTRTVPIGFVPGTRVPPLLGRHAFLDSFEVLLSKRKELVLWE